jgi:hypothetical protein
MDVFSDDDIAIFISEPKVVPAYFADSSSIEKRFKDERGHFVFKEDNIMGVFGDKFTLIIRRSKKDVFNFSVIFGLSRGGNDIFRLRRYNGDHGEHTNILEKGTPDWKFEGFHIHKATQRYQELGIQEEGFAEKTNKYTDWKGALKCAMSENNCTIEVAPNQKRL